jgi:hypothetical protein
MKAHLNGKLPVTFVLGTTLIALAVGTACAGSDRGASTAAGGSGGSDAGGATGNGNAGSSAAGNMNGSGGRDVSGPAGGNAGSATAGGATSGGSPGAAGSQTGNGGTTSTGGVRATGGAGNQGTAGTSSGGSAVGGSGSGGAPNAKLAPVTGALLGEYYGDGSVADTEARIGRKPALHLTYVAVGDDFSRVAKSDASSGKIALISWEPAGIDFNDIVGGKLDSMLMTQATAAKGVGSPFFIDFAAEMNGDEAWSASNAALYISGYRHIHDLFVAAGATNVVWAWCPNVTDTDGGNKHTLDYYPGDSYVDWTGVDGYNWGSGQGFSWQSFHDVFARIYPILAGKGKPILIGEMASDENGGDKGMWIDAMIPTLKSDFPLIKGLVWFDVHKERSWQINSSPASLAAYQRFAKDPYMNP